jgi:hypothetical protein
MFGGRLASRDTAHCVDKPILYAEEIMAISAEKLTVLTMLNIIYCRVYRISKMNNRNKNVQWNFK